MRWKTYEDFKKEYESSSNELHPVLDFYHKRKIIIDDFKDLIELLTLNIRFNKKFFYRGHFNSDWMIESTYARDKEKLSINNEGYKDLLIKVWIKKMDFFKRKNPNKKILEILTEFRHLNLKSPLIDFTSDIYIALWFCIYGKENNEEFFEEEYYSLFVLESKNIFDELNDLNEKNKIYSCPKNIKRGISQKSFFILDNQFWEKKTIKIVISKKLRSKIKELLENQNIDSMTIFPDLKGLFLESEEKVKDDYLDEINYLKLYWKIENLWKKDKREKIKKYYKKFYSLYGVFNKSFMIKNAPESKKNNPHIYYFPYNQRIKKIKFMEQVDSKMTHLEKMLNKEPKNIELLLQLAICFKRKSNFDEAIKLLDEILLIDDKNIEAIYEKGLILKEYAYDDKNYFEKALKLFKKIIDLKK